MSNRLHIWIIKIWEEGHVPQVWKDANIVTIYKKETELSVVKIIARILLNILSNHIIPEVGGRDTVWLSFKPKHNRHDNVPTTTP